MLLRKGLETNEYIDDWEKINKTSTPEKEDIYIKNLGEYYDLYVQSDTLLLADVFENLRIMCLKIYELDPAKLLSASGLAWL